MGNTKTLLLQTGIVVIFFVGGVFANQLYSEFISKEFLGCESGIYDPQIEKVSEKIFYLMKEGKYEEAITFGNRHLKDDGIWYCDNYFWIQRSQAFYNLNNCYQAIVAAAHAVVVSPEDNGANEPIKELYSFIINSDICVKPGPEQWPWKSASKC